MDSSGDECLVRRNETRPTVIYFHGLREGSLETGHIIATNRSEVERCLNLRDEDLTSKSERKLDTGTDTKICARDSVSLETEEDCLRKRHRTSFTSSQLRRLEEEFDEDCYIVGMKRWRLSEELEIPEKQIKIWFQNKRTKVKKHCSN